MKKWRCLINGLQTGCFAPGNHPNDESTNVLLYFRPVAGNTSHPLRGWSLTLLVWLAAPVMAFANTLSMDDFAYGIRISVPAGVAVAAATLPETVYRSAFRGDLGDIRVFNASGEPVPHLLSYAQSQLTETPWRVLPYFPIPEDVNENAVDYNVYVRTGPDGAMVRIHSPNRSATHATQAARTILVDISGMPMDLTELRLAWQPGTMNQMVFISVEASDDLVNWQRLQSRAVIADIQYAGHRFTNNTVSFSPTRKQYLRVRLLKDGPSVVITSIQGRSIPEGRNPVRVFLTLDGRPLDGAQGRYAYDTGGAFPVDRVNLLFGQANSMADAQLASRNTQNGEWRLRYNGLFYRIDVEGTPLTSIPQPASVSMDRYWQLTIDDSESTIGRSIPQLEIGYRPHDLYFIARGKGPFTLAFGSAMAEPLKTNVAALVDSINRRYEKGIEHWVFPTGEAFELGGSQRLKPPSQPLPIRRMVLWSILLAGVLIVAAMAWRLARRLKP